MTKRDGSSQLGSCRKQVQVKKKKKGYFKRVRNISGHSSCGSGRPVFFHMIFYFYFFSVIC